MKLSSSELQETLCFPARGHADATAQVWSCCVLCRHVSETRPTGFRDNVRMLLASVTRESAGSSLAQNWRTEEITFAFFHSSYSSFHHFLTSRLQNYTLTTFILKSWSMFCFPPSSKIKSNIFHKWLNLPVVLYHMFEMFWVESRRTLDGSAEVCFWCLISRTNLI